MPKAFTEPKTTRTTETCCPFCDFKLDAATSEEGATPEPGDLSVCISCASALVFTDDLSLRAMTKDEFLALDAREAGKLRRYQRTVRGIDRRKVDANA